MARHKTTHRKQLDAHHKTIRALRAEAVQDLAASGTLKPNAAKRAKRK